MISLIALGLQSCHLKSDQIEEIKDAKNSTEIDYSPLTKQLKAKNWRSADVETLRLMMVLRDRTTSGWLSQADVEKLDCQALVQIDRLWEEHSQGKFGFNRQRLIWLSVGGTVGKYSPNIAEKFGSRVGWRNAGKWLPYQTLNFSNQAPQGHLPATTGNGVSGSVWGGVGAIAQRLQYCRHEVSIANARKEYYRDCRPDSTEHYCRLKRAAERWGERPDWGGTGIAKALNELEQELAQRQWAEADRITQELLDRYRRASDAEGLPGADSMEFIPCYLLKPVDDLWMQYSQGRFGLTAQAAVLAKLEIRPSGYETNVALAAFGWDKVKVTDPYLSSLHRPYDPAFNAVDPKRVPEGFYPYNMGHSYSTYGSGYTDKWRIQLNPVCGFN